MTILCIGLIIIAIASGIFVPRGGPRQVDLRVESSSGVAMVTYSYPSTSVSNAFSVTTPWDKIVTLNGGDQVYLSAGNPSSFGKLTCTITVDNRPWKQVSVEYPSDKVGCAGIIP
ncbi:MAG TPA: hypothetical protein VMS73_05295 [Anaerolineaceae bacterium]|nr:hypothetical protein [Anaerolineaceae bacterium]